jgi:hypothetical protein
MAEVIAAFRELAEDRPRLDQVGSAVSLASHRGACVEHRLADCVCLSVPLNMYVHFCVCIRVRICVRVAQTAMVSHFTDPEDQAYLSANMPLSDEGYDYHEFCAQLFAR